MTIPAPTPQDIQVRVRAISAKMLDAAEHMLDRINTPEPLAPVPLPLNVARRQMANILGLPPHCHRARCRWTKTCDGEPVHCLNICMPALPHGVLARILSIKAMRRRMRRR
jgi:hypothetical protein